jgi:hypothetical protein
LISRFWHQVSSVGLLVKPETENVLLETAKKAAALVVAAFFA